MPSDMLGRYRIAINHARRCSEGLVIPDVSSLELAALLSKGGIRLDVSLESFFEEVEDRFRCTSDQWADVRSALELAGPYPKDPADLLLRRL